jgi:hypothetical protein
MGQSEDQKNHLREAVAAAARHDARDYITELAASHVLDGLARSLGFHWPGLDQTTLEEVVSEAADALYAKVTEGGIVREPAGFLWGTASNLLKVRRRQGRLDTKQFDDESIEHNAAGDIQEQPERDRAAMLAVALRFARVALPRLGQENIIRVMAYILDCVEAGELYVDNQHIGDALGLTAEAVAKLKHRGFKRLEREARKHGVRLAELRADQNHHEHEDEQDEGQE